MNAELFNIVANKIDEEDGEHYDQGSYGIVQYPYRHQSQCPTICNSAFCIAGHTVLALGWTVRFTKDADYENWFISRWVDETGAGRTEYALHAAAREALGLTHSEADKLFAADWQPDPALSVSDALRAIGTGESVYVVSR